MSKFTIDDFKGVIPAMLTIFDKQEEIDEQGLRDFIQYLLKFDIGGLYVTGSTGETFLMSVEERKRVLEIIMDEVQDKVPVVAHIGELSTAKSIDLAKHAEKQGVVGISSVPPFYWKHTEEAIVKFYKDIAESTNLPMIVYNIPLAGMMSVQTIEKLSKIKNVRGIKYTGTTLFELTQIKDFTPDNFLIYGGVDEMASSNASLGVDGIIGSFYNIVPDLFIKIFEMQYKCKNEEALKLQEQAVRIIVNVLAHGSMTGAMKALLRDAGIHAGYSRRPFINFSDEKKEQVSRSLVELANKYDIKDLNLIDRLKEKYNG